MATRASHTDGGFSWPRGGTTSRCIHTRCAPTLCADTPGSYPRPCLPTYPSAEAETPRYLCRLCSWPRTTATAQHRGTRDPRAGVSGRRRSRGLGRAHRPRPERHRGCRASSCRACPPVLHRRPHARTVGCSQRNLCGDPQQDRGVSVSGRLFQGKQQGKAPRTRSSGPAGGASQERCSSSLLRLELRLLPNNQLVVGKRRCGRPRFDDPRLSHRRPFDRRSNRRTRLRLEPRRAWFRHTGRELREAAQRVPGARGPCGFPARQVGVIGSSPRAP